MRVLSLACLLALAAVAVAGAQKGKSAVSDGNDSKSLVDLAMVRMSHDADRDRLSYVVRTHAPISPRNFRNAVSDDGPPGSVCINIWTSRKPREAPPNFDACVTGDRSREKLLASVSRIKAGGKVRRAGAATAELTSKRRLVVQFDPDLIGHPAAYRWSVHSTTFERGCRTRGCEDFAPRAGRTVRTKLG